MKTIFAIIVLGLFSLDIQNASARIALQSNVYTIPATAHPSLPQQIAQLIPLPGVLCEEDGVVALSFKVDKNSRILNIKVYIGNEELNQHIISHLQGKQLYGQGFEGKKQYRVRIHFAQSQILAASYASF